MASYRGKARLEDRATIFEHTEYGQGMQRSPNLFQAKFYKEDTRFYSGQT
jgi:hypothetical protein